MSNLPVIPEFAILTPRGDEDWEFLKKNHPLEHDLLVALIRAFKDVLEEARKGEVFITLDDRRRVFNIASGNLSRRLGLIRYEFVEEEQYSAVKGYLTPKGLAFVVNNLQHCTWHLGAKEGQSLAASSLYAYLPS